MTGWVIPTLAFAAVAVAVALLAYLTTASGRRTQRRVQALSRDPRARRAAPGGGDRFPTLTALLERQQRHSAIQDRLDRAGVPWRPSEFVAAAGAGLVVLAAGGWLLLGALGAAAGILLAVVAAYGVLMVLEARRLREFERQLPDALMLVASSLRSGYGVLRAMQAVRDEMKPPISVEFGKTLEETNVGMTTPEALLHLARRVPLPDLDIAVTAMLIQLDVGGNLAEVMEIVARTVRERQRIRAEVNTLTAEGRLSGVILFLLPLAMAFILAVLNPSYMSVLFRTSLGHMLILLAIGLQIVGGFVITRMLQIDF